MTKVEKLLSAAKEAKGVYEDAHALARYYDHVALSAYHDAEIAYSKYYGELEKSNKE